MTCVLAALVGGALLLPAMDGLAGPDDLHSSLERFDQSVASHSALDSDLVKARQVLDRYRIDVQPWLASRGRWSGEEGQRLFHAVYAAYFYTLSDEVMTDLATVFGQLRAAGSIREEEVREFHRALVGGRRFGQARTLANDFHLEDASLLNTVHLDAMEGPRAIRFLSEDEGVVESWRTDGLVLVMVAHPGCGFSRRAVSAIREDGQLRRWISEHGLLLAPQDLTGDLGVFSRWALDHPDLPIRVAYRRDGFPFIDSWATPNFYVLRNGEVVSRLNGWPAGRTTAPLKAALQSAGAQFAD